MTKTKTKAKAKAKAIEELRNRIQRYRIWRDDEKSVAGQDDLTTRILSLNSAIARAKKMNREELKEFIEVYSLDMNY